MKFVSAFLYILLFILSLLGTNVIPWSVSIAIVVIVALLSAFCLARKISLFNSRLFPVLSLIALPVLASFSWNGVLENYSENQIWLSFAILALAALLFITKISTILTAYKESQVFKPLYWGLPAFAVIVSVGAYLISDLTTGIAEQQEMMIPVVGAFHGGTFYEFEPWITGKADTFQLLIFALAAWTLCCTSLLSLVFGKELLKEEDNKASKPAAIYIFALIGCLIYSALTVFVPHFNVNVASLSKVTDDNECGKNIEKMLKSSKKARVAKAIFAEKKMLKAGVSASFACNDFTAASIFSSRLVSLFPGKKSHLLTFATSLYEAGRKEALAIFNPYSFNLETMAEIKPRNIYEAHYIAQIYSNRNRLDEVVKVLSPYEKESLAAIKRLGKSSIGTVYWRVLYRYAEYCLYIKRYDDALSVVENLLKIDPDNGKLIYLKGATYYDKGDSFEAFRNLNHAVKLLPVDMNSRNNLAAIYTERGEADTAKSLTRDSQLKISSKSWGGKQGNKLFLPGEAFYQGVFIPGLTNLQVILWGTKAAGEWPEVEFVLNNQVLSKVKITNEEPRRFPFDFIMRRGMNRIAFRFVNDFSDGKEDRNLFIGGALLSPVFVTGEKR